MSPDASGRIRPVSIPRVPWHDVELRTVRKGPVITDWYDESGDPADASGRIRPISVPHLWRAQMRKYGIPEAEIKDIWEARSGSAGACRGSRTRPDSATTTAAADLSDRETGQ